MAKWHLPSRQCRNPRLCLTLTRWLGQNLLWRAWEVLWPFGLVGWIEYEFLSKRLGEAVVTPDLFLAHPAYFVSLWSYKGFIEYGLDNQAQDSSFSFSVRAGLSSWYDQRLCSIVVAFCLWLTDILSNAVNVRTFHWLTARVNLSSNMVVRLELRSTCPTEMWILLD